ncbi:MAG: hypothetical protein IPH48_10055 [bacterium]|nr:hypothetical protein [bacterium]
MKTRVIVHRSLLRGTFYILAALSLIAYLLPARAEAGVRVVAQVGPVAVDYRDRGPGYDARAAVYLEPVAARVLVGRPACGPDRPGCLVRVVDRCDRHDRNRDGRCDKCERRDRRDDRRDDRHACDDRGGRDGFSSHGDRCEHSDRCVTLRHHRSGRLPRSPRADLGGRTLRTRDGPPRPRQPGLGRCALGTPGSRPQVAEAFGPQRRPAPNPPGRGAPPLFRPF